MMKCTKCGKFISYFELDNGNASRQFVPDTHFSVEKMEFFCSRCNLTTALTRIANTAISTAHSVGSGDPIILNITPPQSG